MTDDFPTIPIPIARGASRCHVLAVRDKTGTMVAACGISCGRFCEEEGFETGKSTCDVHQEPLCEQCVEIVEEFQASGEWRGVPENPWHGLRRTPCLQHRCPELIVVPDCWCNEHLDACREEDCKHGAHYCEDPVHYCADHGGPE